MDGERPLEETQRPRQEDHEGEDHRADPKHEESHPQRQTRHVKHEVQ